MLPHDAVDFRRTNKLRPARWSSSALFGRGTTRAGNAQGKLTQSEISPSIQVYDDQNLKTTYPHLHHSPEFDYVKNDDF